MREMTRDEALPFLVQRPRTAIIATVRSTARRTPRRSGSTWTASSSFSRAGAPR
jgi:hypothetical protein